MEEWMAHWMNKAKEASDVDYCTIIGSAGDAINRWAEEGSTDTFADEQQVIAMWENMAAEGKVWGDLPFELREHKFLQTFKGELEEKVTIGEDQHWLPMKTVYLASKNGNNACICMSKMT
jgi:hypothetical protein